MITGIGVHDPPESVFTIEWNLCSRSNGIRVHDPPESAQWDRIMDLLPGRPGSVGVTAADNRLFVEAVLYRYRAGIPWADLPERFGGQ